jgi:phosphoglycolate phosphatase-like HAD superfamily hydrolase
MEYGSPKEDTGGDVVLANFGLDMYFERVFCSLSAQVPVAQSLPYSQPASAARYNLGISYLF